MRARSLVPSVPLALAPLAVLLATPGAAAAAPEVTATPSAAGVPARIAWATGREVRVAGPDGVGERVVARARRTEAVRNLDLSRDGTRLAVTTRDGVRVLDLVGGGPLRVLDRRSSDGARAVAWSPDGRRVLIVGEDDLQRCDLTAAPPCRRVGGKPADQPGAAFSPDGTRFAYLRESPRSAKDDSGIGDLVVVDRGGRSRVLARGSRTARRISLLSSPVWTSEGLAWTSVGIAITAGGDDVRVTRASTRLLPPSGSVRTLTAAAAPTPLTVPFVVASEAPGGGFVGLGSTTVRRTGPDRQDVVVRRVGATGGVPSPLGVAFPLEGLDGEDDPTASYLGALPDGGVAFARTPAGRDDVLELVVLRPDAPAGRPLAVGTVVSIATPYPAITAGNLF